MKFSHRLIQTKTMTQKKVSESQWQKKEGL